MAGRREPGVAGSAGPVVTSAVLGGATVPLLPVMRRPGRQRRLTLPSLQPVELAVGTESGLTSFLILLVSRLENCKFALICLRRQIKLLLWAECGLFSLSYKFLLSFKAEYFVCV